MSLKWNRPAGSLSATLILAHGAGAPMDSPFMERIAELLAAQGIAVARFEFPYMAQRREDGRKAQTKPASAKTVLIKREAGTICASRGAFAKPCGTGNAGARDKLRHAAKSQFVKKRFLTSWRTGSIAPAGRRALNFQFEPRQFCLWQNAESRGFCASGPIGSGGILRISGCGNGQETVLLWKGFFRRKKRPAHSVHAAARDESAKGFPPSRALLKGFDG